MLKNNSKEFKKSPYTIFKEWLCNGDLSSELNPDILKAVSVYSVLSMFGGLNKNTIFINNYFNNYHITKYKNIEEFYKYLKELVLKHNISFYDLTFSKLEKKESKKNKNVYSEFPLLKSYEIELLMNYININPNEYNNLNESLGLNKTKSKKLTKKEEKEFNKINEEITKSETIKENTKILKSSLPKITLNENKKTTFNMLKETITKNKKGLLSI